MPDTPWRDADVTATCLACGGPRPTGHGRAYCSDACRQAGYRRRHAPEVPERVLPRPVSRTATGVYECPGCGERLAGRRRCDDCNLYARRLGTGGACHACGEILTIEELVEAPID